MATEACDMLLGESANEDWDITVLFDEEVFMKLEKLSNEFHEYLEKRRSCMANKV